MSRWGLIYPLSAAFLLGLAGPVSAGVCAPAAAPLLGAGPAGPAVLGVTGAGYLAVRIARRRRR